MKRQDLSIINLPDSPGVYFFRDADGHILYIGKATSLRDRVRSYFNPDLIETRGLRLVSMVTSAHTVTYEQTDSVLEALLLESKRIKEHVPSYNVKEKDDKSFACVVITKEPFPRVLTMRVREFEKRFTKKDVLHVYGPFASASTLREAMKIIRHLFPYRDTCEPFQGKACFNAQIKLCPGVCTGSVSKTEYAKTIARIHAFLSGKKILLKKQLEKEMRDHVRKEHFEQAARLRDTLFALDHIRDASLIKDESLLAFKDTAFRIEAYDIAHLSGTNRVGVMTVIEGGELYKDGYRKFKLEEKNDDYAGLTEVLMRRFNHTEWRYPDLIVVDGGETHRLIAERELASLSLAIPVVAVVKDARHKPKDILGRKEQINHHKKAILIANNEAHRFAIGYHKHRRSKIV